MNKEDTKQAILGFTEFFKGITGNQDLKIPDNIAKEYGIEAALEREPCDDAISRQALYEWIDGWKEKNKYYHPHTQNEIIPICEVIDIIQSLPPVTPQPKTGWIPVSERLPNDRDWYLGIFKEPDTGWVNPLPFICDYVGKETKATTKEFWMLRGYTDRDYKECDYYYNLECVAWMPLPEPYKAESEDKE